MNKTKQANKTNVVYKNEKGYFGINTIVGVGLKNNTKKEIHDYRQPQKSAWFFLDLETGRNKDPLNKNYSWFPGCGILGETTDIVEIKELPNDSSSTIEVIDNINTSIQILNMTRIEQDKPSWYKIYYKVNEIAYEGYIHNELVSDQSIRYDEPLKIETDEE